MNKNILMIIAALAVVVLIAYFWVNKPSAPIDDAQSLEQAAVASADEELQGTDITDLEAEFNAIDAELQGL